MINKRDLARQVSKKLDTTQAEALTVIEAVIEALADNFMAQKSVHLTGFGAWKLKTRAARTLKNPKTGQMMALPVTTALQFSVSHVLKQRLREGKGS